MDTVDNKDGMGEDITPEEYKKLRREAQAELKSEIAFLKTEYEYQDLMAKIEEAKARRLNALQIQYRMTNPESEQQAQPREVYQHPAPMETPFGSSVREPEQPPKKAPAKKGVKRKLKPA